jgi:hypothetical protein
MSISDLRRLAPPSQHVLSYLTEDEWNEVFAAIKRRVRIKDIYEAFAVHKGYTFKGFYQAVAGQRKKHR